jgi:hypothetical protein
METTHTFHLYKGFGSSDLFLENRCLICQMEIVLDVFALASTLHSGEYMFKDE